MSRNPGHSVLILVLGLLVLGACRKDDSTFELDYPTPLILELERNGSFELGDVQNSKIELIVEFYDGNQGLDVASYDWSVEFISSGGNNGNNIDPVVHSSIEASEFYWSVDLKKRASFSLEMVRAIEVLNLKVDQIKQNDLFRFKAVLKMKDGNSFTEGDQREPVLEGDAFESLFTVDVPVGCGIRDDYFIGDYELILGPVDGLWGGPFGETGSVITLIKAGKNERTFIASNERIWNPEYFEYTIQFQCHSLILKDIDTQASCDGISTIVKGQGESELGSYDPTDDSLFTLYMSDDLLGSCGEPIHNISYIFTKL